MPARSWSKGTDHAAQYPRRKKRISFQFDERSLTDATVDKVISVDNEKVIVLPEIVCTCENPTPMSDRICARCGHFVEEK